MLPSPISGTPNTASVPNLESVPAVSVRLKTPDTKNEKFEEMVKPAQAVMVRVLV